MKKKKIKFLISAGPTREPIDSVRFISNYSSGILGYSIANEAVRRGHKVILVSGPVAIERTKGIKCILVKTALEMRTALHKAFKSCDCLVMNAAVCDYRPLKFSKKKIKKTRERFNIELIKNPDILKELSLNKKDKLLIGFAVETEHVFKNAFKKLKSKHLDAIVVSKISRFNVPFGGGRVSVDVIDKDGTVQKIVNSTKAKLSEKLLDRIESLWYNSKQI